MYRITGHYPMAVPGRLLVYGLRERWLVDGDVGPGCSDDDPFAVNGDAKHLVG